MTQYCRYCNGLIVGDVAYCETLEKIISESTAKRANHCKSFEFNPMDAFAENPNDYRPREKHADFEYYGNIFDTEIEYEKIKDDKGGQL